MNINELIKTIEAIEAGEDGHYTVSADLLQEATDVSYVSFTIEHRTPQEMTRLLSALIHARKRIARRAAEKLRPANSLIHEARQPDQQTEGDQA